jgi:hypothetical protein
MNLYQRLWWEQTQSDHSILLLLRRHSAAPCHQLHYLQMVTEKLGKAYFWRSGNPPRKSHVSFVRFLQALDNRPRSDVDRIAAILGFPHAEQFENWIPTITPLAHALERLAPALAGDDGPNPEYPWPRQAPGYAPASFEFAVWKELTDTGRGRQLLKIIDTAIREFPKYG